MGESDARAEDLPARLCSVGADVPEVWVRCLVDRPAAALSVRPRRPGWSIAWRRHARGAAERMGRAAADLRWILERHPRWVIRPGQPNPLGGAAVSPNGWALLVFTGLLAACGRRGAGAPRRALAYDLAHAVAPAPVLGSVPRRVVDDRVRKSRWVREALRRHGSREAAAACLAALEASGALAETPAVVEQARWRLGPGSDATDAEAIRRLVADVLWHCEEDPALLLAALARCAATAAPHPGPRPGVEPVAEGGSS